MKYNQNEIVVSEGKRPFWQTIMAALLYTLSVGLLLYFISFLFVVDYNNTKQLNGVVSFLKLSVFAFVGALQFSVVKTLYINLQKEKLKTEFAVGIFKYSYFSNIPVLEYVSVFKNPNKEVFEVNLWYKGNKHFNVSNFDEFEPDFQFGLHFSNRLNIDLLDATEKGNSKWIEK